MDEDKLKELAASISSQGLIQPLVVRPQGDAYELIAGERRWRAAQSAGVTRVPVVVRDIDDRTTAALSLIENIQREDLSALEEANALQQLAVKFDLKHHEIADIIGRSRSGVTNLLRLLELAPEARELLGNGSLEMGHARVLLRLARAKQGPAGIYMAAEKMSVREAEAYVESLLKKRPRKEGNSGRRAAEIVDLENELSAQLGTPVRVMHGKRGGKLVIRYGNLDILDGILAKIRNAGT